MREDGQDAVYDAHPAANVAVSTLVASSCNTEVAEPLPYWWWRWWCFRTPLPDGTTTSLTVLNFPLSVVVSHLVIKFLLAWISRYLWQCYTSRPRITLNWTLYITKLCPTGVASGLDIAFSNWGLSLITVSLYTMTKSTTILFILGFALLFRLESKSWSLVAIVLMISSGLFLFTYKATQFSLEGFMITLLASFMSGLRWTLAQLIMQKSELGLSNPVDMVYHVQPWMIVSVLPFAVAFEGHSIASSCHTFRYHSASQILHSAGVVLFGAILGYLMEIAEFLVVCQTSSLTLSIAGIVKEAMTLLLAILLVGDRMSPVNFVGLLLCMAGIMVHTLGRTSAALHSSGNRQDEYQLTDKLPLLSAEGETHVKFLVHETSSSEDESGDDSNQVLFSIKQRRDNPVR
ncbi:solute carrier family 35 member C2 isoform X1 [Schistocerca nitens]|uniref:solute carrier family 35 member C2 isoform X1 n=1 Tax=Schistocerca nitens TaxID=7011 RepID=UPI002118B0B8|nr:solute carrier family 35 member C2 isoform X1 [Schistocerca nitens]